jgi:2-amino-4-hydroxy-6-hydroxymethyldihydropteridine diphosphokinase
MSTARDGARAGGVPDQPGATAYPPPARTVAAPGLRRPTASPDAVRAEGRGRLLVIGLGSNLGDRAENLRGGLSAVLDRADIEAVAVSGVYRTDPVGGPPQREYDNAVLIARTVLPARAVLDRCQAVEARFGRVRELRWGPRTLDLDIIVYGDDVSDDPELTLPHPRAHERAFVLIPWLEADPDAVLPGHGRVADLLAVRGWAGVHRLPEVRLGLPA